MNLLSCKDFLEPYPDGNRTGEDLWKYPQMAEGLIGQAYDYIPTDYNNNEEILRIEPNGNIYLRKHLIATDKELGKIIQRIKLE